jgi:hypothetical protein
VVVPLKSGAGKMRAVGRTAGIVALQSVVRPRLEEAFTACKSSGPELERISEHLQIPVPPGTETPEPIVVVLGSMAGGTGAGILLDVIDLVRRTDSTGAFPIAVIFTPDIFNFSADAAMSANGLAMLSELMSAYWDDEISHSDLIPNVVKVDNRGPHTVFLIGRKNLAGSDLKTSQSVYRAVGEALASWVCSSSVQDSVYNFITVNWGMHSSGNMGGYPFDQVRQRGVVSSFGSATISIGRDRLREFASKLLMKELLENLYVGHNKNRTKELGQEAKNMTDAAVLEALLEKHHTPFLQSCGLDELGPGANQISDRFLSDDLAKQELKLVNEEMRSSLRSGMTADPRDWFDKLQAQARQVAKKSEHRAESGFDELIGVWSSETYEKILRSTSDYVGRFGLKFAAELVRGAVTAVAQASADVRTEAADDKKRSASSREEAKSTLRNAGTKDALGLESAVVQGALGSFAKAVANLWRVTRRERTATAMEALSNEVLSILSLQINQAHGEIHELVTVIDGQQPVTASWPNHGKGIPEGFLPSPLEFHLEDYESWPRTLDQLAEESMELCRSTGYQPANSVDATRYLINVGDFPAGRHEIVQPIVWDSRAGGGSPQWAPGQPAQIAVVSNQEEIADRVSSWMSRPSSAMQRYFDEHLRGYLETSDADGNPVPDHKERLTTFRTKLGEAYIQSQPLIDINLALNAVIHPQHPELAVMSIMEGFPFPTGHPAREIVSAVMGADNASFTDGQVESVLISSFIEYPVHPMVVNSFVTPLRKHLNEIGLDSAQLRGAFWLWRRTKVLQDFIPLPDETRLAMIRGFAVARMLGYITADPSNKVRITGTTGPLEFPFPLLTDVSSDNILPALLEAFGLCFGQVSVEGVAAFDAYTRLYQLGESTGQIYVLAEEAETFLRTGVLPFAPEDAGRHQRAKGETEEDRSANLRKYMEDNIRRYDTLQSRPFTGAETRDRFGTVTPEDTLSQELVDDLKNAYEAVLDALITRSSGGVV